MEKERNPTASARNMTKLVLRPNIREKTNKRCFEGEEERRRAEAFKGPKTGSGHLSIHNKTCKVFIS